jgi:hypothetical protein
MRLLYIFLCFSMIGLAKPATIFAQVKFTTIVNQKEISTNDYIEVQYVVENAEEVQSINPPSVFKGFDIVSGPTQQTGMTLINGTLSKYKGIAYTLQATTVGTFSIGGASASVNGKTMTCNPVTITVLHASNNNNNNTQGWPLPDNVLATPEKRLTDEYWLKGKENAKEKIKNNLLARLEVSKTTCYEGEPIVATYKLYSKVKAESKVTKRPSLNGFSVYDMVPSDGSGQPKVEQLNGKLFNTYTIRKVQLYPLQSGKFELDEVELDNTVIFLRLNDGSANSTEELLEQYNSTQSPLEQHHVVIASKPATITVKPLPGNKPISFDGAVGKFTIKITDAPAVLNINETGKIKITIEGKGNLPLINAPKIVWPAQVEVEEPLITETTDKTVCPITGTKTFEYAFTPKASMSFMLPSFQWTYFDPASASYKVLTTTSVVVKITNMVVASNKNKNVSAKQPTTEAVSGWHFNGERYVKWVLLILLLAAFVMVMIKYTAGRKKILVPATPELMPAKASINPTPSSTPNTVVETPLAKVALALAQSDNIAFYNELSYAVWKACAEKLAIDSSQLNKSLVILKLEEKKMSTTVVQQFEQLVKNCEMALYAPTHADSDRQATFKLAESFMQQLQAL